MKSLLRLRVGLAATVLKVVGPLSTCYDSTYYDAAMRR
jgi:hypothetical protein